jgi:GNAT superfamily N-acetyltransferase
MSGPAPIQPGAPAADAPEASAPLAPGWHVRAAAHDDVATVVTAVRDLLIELDGTPPPAAAMEETARALLDDPGVGALLVAQAGEAIVGVLGASWQLAMHVPGRYALIQDLWVHPSWRSRAIGRDLIALLCEHARKSGMARIEVGLPSKRFSGLEATRAFYLRHGFEPLGPRMRRILP